MQVGSRHFLTVSGCGLRAARGPPRLRRRGARTSLGLTSTDLRGRREQACESGACALGTVGRAEQARVLVHGQHQSVDLEHHLRRIDRCAQVSFRHRLPDRLQQLGLPAGDDRDHRIALRAGPVVVLDRAGNHDAAACQFARKERDPSIEDRLEPGQSARLSHGRAQDLVDEAAHVRLEHGQLQVLARAEVREDAALAHVHLVGQRADRQALQAVAARRSRAPPRRWPRASGRPCADAGRWRSMTGRWRWASGKTAGCGWRRHDIKTNVRTISEAAPQRQPGL